MSPLIDRAAMELVFDDELVTVNAGAAAAIPHEPTRAFLRDIGLPDRFGWFEADDRLMEDELEIGGDGWAAVAARYPRSTFDMSTWLSIGGIGMDDVSVDTATGAVYCIPEEGAPQLLGGSVDAVMYVVQALEAERPNYDPEEADEENGLTPGEAEERLRALMRTAGLPLDDPASIWHGVLGHVENALSY
ncbi:SUKH-4 family immunity protein [Kitasatospora sp. NPDC004240]